MNKGLLEYTFLLYNCKTFVKILTVPNRVVFVEKDWNANSPVQIFLSLVARPYYPHNPYHPHSSHVPVGLHP